MMNKDELQFSIDMTWNNIERAEEQLLKELEYLKIEIGDIVNKVESQGSDRLSLGSIQSKMKKIERMKNELEKMKSQKKTAEIILNGGNNND